MLLALHGWSIDGGVGLQVKWASCKLRWKDMFQWVEKELRVEAECLVHHRKSGGVHAVTETSPAPEPARSRSQGAQKKEGPRWEGTE